MNLGGKRRHRRRSRLRALPVTAAGAAALAVSLAACGGGSSPGASGTAATYSVRVVTAEFPAEQRLGQTSLLRIGVRNAGRRAVPALTVTISIAGEAGRTSSLPFAIHDPQPGLAQPDRPVWVLSARYPRLAGATISAGADTSNRKTFDFGPLKPGAAIEAVWKLSAVRTGRHTLLYRVGAGPGGSARTSGGVEPGGSFRTRVTPAPPNVVVTDSGEVVPIPQKPRQRRRNR